MNEPVVKYAISKAKGKFYKKNRGSGQFDLIGGIRQVVDVLSYPSVSFRFDNVTPINNTEVNPRYVNEFIVDGTKVITFVNPTEDKDINNPTKFTILFNNDCEVYFSEFKNSNTGTPNIQPRVYKRGTRITCWTHKNLFFIEDYLPRVGEILVEYPNQPSPQQLYPSVTWVNISSAYAGLFFRVEGGQSLPFNSGNQGDQLQIHNHITIGYTNPQVSSGFPDFHVMRREHGETTLTLGNGNVGRFGSETRPVNTTIRLWMRVLTEEGLSSKRFYIFDRVTKVYSGTYVYLLKIDGDYVGYDPAIHTDITPPAIPTPPVGSPFVYVLVFNSTDQAWIVTEDWRGVRVWEKSTATSRDITEFGDKINPETETLKSPEGIVDPVWDEETNSWISDPSNEFKLGFVNEYNQMKEDMIAIKELLYSSGIDLSSLAKKKKTTKKK